MRRLTEYVLIVAADIIKCSYLYLRITKETPKNYTVIRNLYNHNMLIHESYNVRINKDIINVLQADIGKDKSVYRFITTSEEYGFAKFINAINDTIKGNDNEEQVVLLTSFINNKLHAEK